MNGRERDERRGTTSQECRKGGRQEEPSSMDVSHSRSLRPYLPSSIPVFLRSRALVLAAAVLVPACDARPSGTPANLSTSLRLTVDPRDPGPAEFPGDVLSEPFPWRWAVVGSAAAIVGSALLVRRALARRAADVRVDPPTGAPSAVAPGPHERALQRIDRLRGQVPREPSQIESFHVEASSLVRDYVGARFELETEQMTTEQCLESSRGAVEPVRHGELAAVLHACDGVKFARQSPSDAERTRMLDAAAAFVQATAPVGPESAT